MPQLGESVHEGTIARWLVQPGGRVEEFEPMLEVETDKVATEVPAPVTGILREILQGDGATVQAGSEIGVVEIEGAETGAEAPPAETPKTKAGQTDEAHRPEAAAPPPPAEAETTTSPAVVSKSAATEPAPTTAATGPAAKLESGEHRFSPAVRLLAEERKVQLERIKGSGLGGRVTKKDVLSAAEAPIPSITPAATAAPSAAAGAAATPVAMEGDEKLPLSRIKRLVGENMVRSKSTIPHAWQTQEVDMSGVVANRAANKTRFQREEGFSLTYLPYVVMSAITALREHRDVNASFGGDHILLHRDINVGISVGMEDALIVPVIKKADGLSLAGVARAINDIATRARDGKLKGDDLQGGTFTVNNSGTFGTLFSYSVIAPGQAGILTMEAIVERPVAIEGMIGIKPMMYLCFSFDHRVLDGLQAARFLVSCRKWLSSVTVETSIY